MDWDELKQNPLIWVILVLLVLMVGGFFASKAIINKVTQQVIETLQKDYSPGPYAPGFNPDKVDPNHWRQMPPTQVPPQAQPFPTRAAWESEWEQTRR